jgi:predicted lipoprotein with Yx(FWY)xxD motif
VLVDAAGAALYAADQEADGSIVCIASCATIWEPLTLAGSEAPTGGTGLSGRLDVVRRPDGARQVTFEGRPLYRFALDPEPGIVTGNGLADSFDGRTFSWHVATPEGVSTSDANSPSDPPGYDLAG